MTQIEHPYGWLSLVPPLLVIVLAIASRRIILSLLAGIAVGSLMTMTVGGSFSDAIYHFVNTHLWEPLTDAGRLQIFAFTLLMGGMIGIIHKSGAMHDLVNRLSVWATNRKSGQFMTWVFGLIVFFDDYANTVLLGTTMQSFCDRLKISRQKLAYLVDSTAAPVAGLALVSTWVATEIAYVYNGLSAIDSNAENSLAFTAFVQSIPYRFYIVWALLFVPMVALSGRDFGAMYRAERDALAGINHTPPSSQSNISARQIDAKSNWLNVVIPISITVVAIFVFMYMTGRESLGETAADARLYEIVGNCDPNLALLWGSLLGFAITFLLIFVQGLLPFDKIVEGAWTGAQLMIPALAILWLASCLSTMTQDSPNASDKQKINVATVAASVLFESGKSGEEICNILLSQGTELIPLQQALSSISSDTDQVELWMKNAGFRDDEIASAVNFPFRSYRLSTGAWLKDLLSGWDARWLPTIIFILSSFVAFATGSSWGTMGIIMPLAIPLAFSQLNIASLDESLSSPVMLASIGGVLSGAIFGDHCSPISDTTVLSSQASGCDHMAHVITQLPYALTVGIIAILFGTIPIGFGVPVWVLLPIGILVMLATLFLLGKQPETPPAEMEKQNS